MTREIERIPVEMLIAPYHGRHQLVAQARGLSQAGQIQIIRARPEWNESKQRWELPVRWLRSASPWPRRLWVAAGILGFLAILGWVLSSLDSRSLLALCAAALAWLAYLVHRGRRPSVQVTTVTKVTVR